MSQSILKEVGSSKKSSRSQNVGDRRSKEVLKDVGRVKASDQVCVCGQITHWLDFDLVLSLTRK